MTRAARPGEINGDAIDRFTLGHLAAGVLRHGLERREGAPAVQAQAEVGLFIQAR